MKKQKRDEKIKQYFKMMVFGFILVFQNIVFAGLNIIAPSEYYWDWSYNTSGMIAVIGSTITIIGLIFLHKEIKKMN